MPRDKSDAGPAPSELADTVALAPSEVADTLGAASLDSSPRVVDTGPTTFGGDTGARYATNKVLGYGGMGEVHLCRDARIGREVAMKVARANLSDRPDARARFLREVRVQGQLEHPSVVPVYDLGANDRGDIFFTMKRVKGSTLADIIQGLRDGDPETTTQFTRRKLLGALSQVCLAVAFSHSRGVIHRDLKPANIMLGDFGEVYVLDWGVAKISTAPDLPIEEASEPTESTPLDSAGEIPSAPTEAGTVLGTPGYMSPEQVMGDVDAVGPAADIYALGTILFEVLALEALHRGPTPQAIMLMTLKQTDPRPSARAVDADIPPELDALCERALCLAPEERFASAREMNDTIERFLDGERDVERRRSMVQDHIERAQEAMDEARRSEQSSTELEARAMRELGSAIALDPTHPGAMGMLRELLLRPPTEIPPEAEAELLEVDRRDRARSAWAAGLTYGAMALFAPLSLLMGFTDARPAIAIELSLIAIAVYSMWMGHTGNATPKYMRIAILLCFIDAGLLSTMFGPFVFVPAVVIAIGTVFIASLRPNRGTRHGILALSLAAVLVPAALAHAGIVAPFYAFEHGQVRILPTMLEFPPTAAFLALAGQVVMTILIANVLVGRATERLVRAERRLHAQAWRLRQLLPDGAQTRAPESDMRLSLGDSSVSHGHA